MKGDTSEVMISMRETRGEYVGVVVR